MGNDDDIIVAGEDPVDDRSRDRDTAVTETCDDCGAELEWELGLDCVQRRVCPNCPADK